MEKATKKGNGLGLPQIDLLKILAQIFETVIKKFGNFSKKSKTETEEILEKEKEENNFPIIIKKSQKKLTYKEVTKQKQFSKLQEELEKMYGNTYNPEGYEKAKKRLKTAIKDFKDTIFSKKIQKFLINTEKRIEEEKKKEEEEERKKIKEELKKLEIEKREIEIREEKIKQERQKLNYERFIEKKDFEKAAKILDERIVYLQDKKRYGEAYEVLSKAIKQDFKDTLYENPFKQGLKVIAKTIEERKEKLKILPINERMILLKNPYNFANRCLELVLIDLNRFETTGERPTPKEEQKKEYMENIRSNLMFATKKFNSKTNEKPTEEQKEKAKENMEKIKSKMEDLKIIDNYANILKQTRIGSNKRNSIDL